MCYFDQHFYACGDWKWGHFRQHCNQELRTGETCGMKLVMSTIRVESKCVTCKKIDIKLRRRAAEIERIERWKGEGGRFLASIDRAYDNHRTLDAEISALESYKATTTILFESGPVSSSLENKAAGVTNRKSHIYAQDGLPSSPRPDKESPLLGRDIGKRDDSEYGSIREEIPPTGTGHWEKRQLEPSPEIRISRIQEMAIASPLGHEKSRGTIANTTSMQVEGKYRRRGMVNYDDDSFDNAFDNARTDNDASPYSPGHDEPKSVSDEESSTESDQTGTSGESSSSSSSFTATSTTSIVDVEALEIDDSMVNKAERRQVPPRRNWVELSGKILFKFRKTCFLLILIGILVICISTTLAVSWSVLKHDVSGGFTMGSYVATVGAIPLGLAGARHYPHCKCFFKHSLRFSPVAQS